MRRQKSKDDKYRINYMEPTVWAGHCLFGSPHPFIHEASIRHRRNKVCEYLGEAWAGEGETWQSGWRRAYRAGWRVVPVVVRKK